MSAQSPSATTASFACHLRLEFVPIDSHSDDDNSTRHMHVHAFWTTRIKL
jgi:hypothetical protein